MLIHYFSCIDFKSPVNGIPSISTSTRKGMRNVHGTNRFFAVDGLLAQTRFRQLRPTIWRQLPNPEILLFRSIPLHDLRANHIPGKPPRYRNMSACTGIQTLSCWHSRQGLSKHSCRCKREKRLAYLCRLRPGFDRHRQKTVCQGKLRNRSGTDGIRLRFHHHRSLSFAVSLGAISQTQGRRQTAHTDRLTWKYPLFYQHHGWKNA